MAGEGLTPPSVSRIVQLGGSTVAIVRFLPLILLLAACAPDAPIGPAQDGDLVFISHTDFQAGTDTAEDAAADAAMDVAVDAPDTGTPAATSACMPCNDDSDCGAGDSRCVALNRGNGFVDGSFCLPDCVTDTQGSCASGYSCKVVTLAAGATGAQCMPDLGDCACTGGWAQQGIATSCHKADSSGTCVGKRQCQVGDNGQPVLTACNAPIATTEVCGDGVDNDCNGQTDEAGSLGCTNYYSDKDGDGYGSGGASPALCRCSSPGAGWSVLSGDCNDADAQIHPGAVESCDGIDDNCNGLTDEPGSKGCTVEYADADGDGFGNPSISMCLCSAEAGWVPIAGDCSDTAVSIHPGATETCDGVDNNCNGKTDEGFCEDGNACTADLCSAVTPSECVHTAIDATPCDDGDTCTIGVCLASTCTPTGALNCDDGNACTADSCDSISGCVHSSLDGAACDDGNPCTLPDACTQGSCSGPENSCGNGTCDCGETHASCPGDCP